MTTNYSGRLRFGSFIAPFHGVNEDPTLALERDLELVQHLDELGFDEAWIGEHHSAGYEIISSAIIKNGPNPEGARKWMDFVLSPAGQNVALTVGKFQVPSNKNAQTSPAAPKPADVKLIKLDLDKYGSKEGRERLLTRWDNEVFKAPK